MFRWFPQTSKWYGWITHVMAPLGSENGTSREFIASFFAGRHLARSEPDNAKKQLTPSWSRFTRFGSVPAYALIR
jgi:hypothetical protein